MYEYTEGENKVSTSFGFIQVRLAFSYEDSRGNTFRHTLKYLRLK